MKTSERGVGLIKTFEGFRSEPYLDSGGIPTIGYGSTFYANGQPVLMQDDPITDEQATRLMMKVLTKFEDGVNRAVTVPLNQNQFDALVSLAYNIGVGAFTKSTLVERLNAGLYKDAANQFQWWRKAGGKVVQGLVNRRAKEKVLFLMAVNKKEQQSMDYMDLIKSSLGTLIRHGGNAIGVWLVSKGLIDAEQAMNLTNYIVGGGLILAMGVWSIIRTKISEKLGL